jgi:hypothetical protein
MPAMSVLVYSVIRLRVVDVSGMGVVRG